MPTFTPTNERERQALCTIGAALLARQARDNQRNEERTTWHHERSADASSSAPQRSGCSPAHPY